MRRGKKLFVKSRGKKLDLDLLFRGMRDKEISLPTKRKIIEYLESRIRYEYEYLHYKLCFWK